MGGWVGREGTYLSANLINNGRRSVTYNNIEEKSCAGGGESGIILCISVKIGVPPVRYVQAPPEPPAGKVPEGNTLEEL